MCSHESEFTFYVHVHIVRDMRDNTGIGWIWREQISMMYVQQS